MSTLTPEEASRAVARAGIGSAAAIEGLPAPVIACVDGFALGGGLELALACDLIYATDASSFGQPEVRLGLIPGFGGTVRLPRAVGLARAKELIYTGRRIGIDEAVAAGLVARRFADRDALLAGRARRSREISANSPHRRRARQARARRGRRTAAPRSRPRSRSAASRTRSARTTCARASPRSSRSGSRGFSAAPDAGVSAGDQPMCAASQANPSNRTPSAPNISRCRCGPVDWPVVPTSAELLARGDVLAHRDRERAVLHVRVGARDELAADVVLHLDVDAEAAAVLGGQHDDAVGDRHHRGAVAGVEVDAVVDRSSTRRRERSRGPKPERAVLGVHARATRLRRSRRSRRCRRSRPPRRWAAVQPRRSSPRWPAAQISASLPTSTVCGASVDRVLDGGVDGGARLRRRSR